MNPPLNAFTKETGIKGIIASMCYLNTNFVKGFSHV